MFVSESKFREAPHAFIPHILASPPNADALAALITKPAVEAALLVRLGNKANIYGQELDPQGRLRPADEAGGAPSKIDTQEVVGLYRDWVIPLTKDVEVRSALERGSGASAGSDVWEFAGRLLDPPAGRRAAGGH